jgi:SAM-dependent methyltransferase
MRRDARRDAEAVCAATLRWNKQGEIMSGWQLSGDAPIAYDRFALKVMEPWTDDLILAGSCRDGDRVLDVACGTGLVSGRIGLVTSKFCSITGIDVNEGMLSVARRNPQIEWHQGSATELPFCEWQLRRGPVPTRFTILS